MPLSNASTQVVMIMLTMSSRGHFRTATMSRYFPDALWKPRDAEATLAGDREHVGPFIIRHAERFAAAHVTSTTEPHPELRITLDYPEDLVLIRGIYERLYPGNPDFGLADILALRRKEPELFEINRLHADCG